MTPAYGEFLPKNRYIWPVKLCTKNPPKSWKKYYSLCALNFTERKKCQVWPQDPGLLQCQCESHPAQRTHSTLSKKYCVACTVYWVYNTECPACTVYWVHCCTYYSECTECYTTHLLCVWKWAGSSSNLLIISTKNQSAHCIVLVWSGQPRYICRGTIGFNSSVDKYTIAQCTVNCTIGWLCL